MDAFFKHRFFTIIAFIISLAVILLATLRIAHPITSNDLWWHIVYGSQVLDQGNLVIDHSIYSWTPAKAYYVYNAPLAQVILYLTYKTGGIPALLGLRYAAFLFVIWLAWRYARLRGIVTHPLTWLILFIALAFALPKQAVKPELFSLVMMTITVWLFYRMRAGGDRTWYYPYFYPLILVIWINLHGAFFLASPFILAVVIGDLLNARFHPDQALPARTRKHLWIALALCLPALLLNPYGYRLPWHIIQDVVHHQVTGMKNISDYLPTYLYNKPPNYLLDYLIASMVVFVFLVWQKIKAGRADWVVILSYLAYAALFIQMIRVVHFLAPVFLFGALDLLAYRQNSWAWPKRSWAAGTFALLALFFMGFFGWRIVNDRGCLVTHPSLLVQDMLMPKAVLAEADYIDKHMPGQRIGNIYRDGGVLILKLWPKKKVMIDPRAFPYDAWIQDYFDFSENGQNIEKFVNEHSADFWLIHYSKTAPFSWFARSTAWKPAYFGPRAAIFVPADQAPAVPVIDQQFDQLVDQNDYGVAFVDALFLDDLTFARHINQAAHQNLPIDCEQNRRFLEEMEITLEGHEAFRKGEYKKAAGKFLTPTEIFRNQDKANEALMKLAEQARSEGDLKTMRQYALQAYLVVQDDQRRMIDLYNMALADWLYRHSKMALVLPPKDDLTWERITDYIIQHEKELPPDRAFIAKVAHEMQAGTFDADKAPFIPRNL